MQDVDEKEVKKKVKDKKIIPINEFVDEIITGMLEGHPVTKIRKRLSVLILDKKKGLDPNKVVKFIVKNTGDADKAIVANGVSLENSSTLLLLKEADVKIYDVIAEVPELFFEGEDT